MLHMDQRPRKKTNDDLIVLLALPANNVGGWLLLTCIPSQNFQSQSYPDHPLSSRATGGSKADPRQMNT